jgi:hypothetical protein
MRASAPLLASATDGKIKGGENAGSLLLWQAAYDLDRFFMNMAALFSFVLPWQGIAKANLGAVLNGSDAAHFAEAAVPAVLYGPGDGNIIHTDEEHVPDAALVRGTETIALSLIKLEQA